MAGNCKRQSDLLESGVGELTLLPLFLDLAGKKALVTGSSQGAKWKVELLRSAGAVVDQHNEPSMGISTLQDYSFIVADIADDAEASKFAKAAQAAGVAYNMVDRPELCQFQFGAIVNRSPVIVSISTSGAAPVLAQTIRERIEGILPENLGAWGALAKCIRNSITHAIHDSGLRRAVWRRFAGLAIGGAVPADEHSLLLSLLETSSQLRKPIVLEIPSERDLMTLRDCRALMNADVAYDYSGRSFVHSLMRREAEYISLNPSQREEIHAGGQHNVVICVSNSPVDVWQPEIDVLATQGYRHFP